MVGINKTKYVFLYYFSFDSRFVWFRGDATVCIFVFFHGGTSALVSPHERTLLLRTRSKNRRYPSLGPPLDLCHCLRLWRSPLKLVGAVGWVERSGFSKLGCPSLQLPNTNEPIENPSLPQRKGPKAPPRSLDPRVCYCRKSLLWGFGKMANPKAHSFPPLRRSG